ncbi:MAG: cupin domain-containing protein [Alphaproteobacteria bacterium]
MSRDRYFHKLDDPAAGIARELAPGMRARIFTGGRLMLSVVTADPHAEGPVHSHPEEQWGLLLEGSGVRIQDGQDFFVQAGDFWHTPPGMPHGFRAGTRGARILDIFSPPRTAYRNSEEGGR